MTDDIEVPEEPAPEPPPPPVDDDGSTPVEPEEE